MKPEDFAYGEVWSMSGSGPTQMVMFVQADLDPRGKSLAFVAEGEQWITVIRLNGSNDYVPEGAYVPWHQWEKVE